MQKTPLTLDLNDKELESVFEKVVVEKQIISGSQVYRIIESIQKTDQLQNQLVKIDVIYLSLKYLQVQDLNKENPAILQTFIEIIEDLLKLITVEQCQKSFILLMYKQLLQYSNNQLTTLQQLCSMYKQVEKSAQQGNKLGLAQQYLLDIFTTYCEKIIEKEEYDNKFISMAQQLNTDIYENFNEEELLQINLEFILWNQRQKQIQIQQGGSLLIEDYSSEGRTEINYSIWEYYQNSLEIKKVDEEYKILLQLYFLQSKFLNFYDTVKKQQNSEKTRDFLRIFYKKFQFSVIDDQFEKTKIQDLFDKEILKNFDNQTEKSQVAEYFVENFEDDDENEEEEEENEKKNIQRQISFQYFLLQTHQTKILSHLSQTDFEVKKLVYLLHHYPGLNIHNQVHYYQLKDLLVEKMTREIQENDYDYINKILTYDCHNTIDTLLQFSDSSINDLQEIVSILQQQKTELNKEAQKQYLQRKREKKQKINKKDQKNLEKLVKQIEKSKGTSLLEKEILFGKENEQNSCQRVVIKGQQYTEQKIQQIITQFPGQDVIAEISPETHSEKKKGHCILIQKNKQVFDPIKDCQSFTLKNNNCSYAIKLKLQGMDNSQISEQTIKEKRIEIVGEISNNPKRFSQKIKTLNKLRANYTKRINQDELMQHNQNLKTKSFNKMVRENLKQNYGVDITEDKYQILPYLAGLGGFSFLPKNTRDEIYTDLFEEIEEQRNNQEQVEKPKRAAGRRRRKYLEELEEVESEDDDEEQEGTFSSIYMMAHDFYSYMTQGEDEEEKLKYTEQFVEQFENGKSKFTDICAHLNNVQYKYYETEESIQELINKVDNEKVKQVLKKLSIVYESDRFSLLVDEKNKVAYSVIKGTTVTSPEDLLDDIVIIFKRFATRLIKQASKALKKYWIEYSNQGYNNISTGHSLGGNTAAWIYKANGTINHSETFNSGCRPTFFPLELPQGKENIIEHHVNGDFISMQKLFKNSRIRDLEAKKGLNAHTLINFL